MTRELLFAGFGGQGLLFSGKVIAYKGLIENKNVTIKKEYLFNNVWGSDSDSEIQTLTVHIKWLREKIEQDPKKPKHIITEWGVGYRFE